MAESLRPLATDTEAEEGVFVLAQELSELEHAEVNLAISGYVVARLGRGACDEAGTLVVRLADGRHVASPYSIYIPEES